MWVAQIKVFQEALRSVVTSVCRMMNAKAFSTGMMAGVCWSITWYPETLGCKEDPSRGLQLCCPDLLSHIPVWKEMELALGCTLMSTTLESQAAIKAREVYRLVVTSAK
jgi:hypothetical protein